MSDKNRSETAIDGTVWVLDPCPWCGGKMKIESRPLAGKNWVVCTGDCGQIGPKGKTPEQAVVRFFENSKKEWSWTAMRPKPRIKPCPVCLRNGAAPSTMLDTASQIPFRLVECDCGARGPRAGTDDEAIDRWNSLPRRSEGPLLSDCLNYGTSGLTKAYIQDLETICAGMKSRIAEVRDQRDEALAALKAEAPKAQPVITYDLDPCPHCRGEMSIENCDCGQSYWVHCNGTCELDGPTAPTEEEATRAFLSLMVGWKHWAYRRKEVSDE
jgi:hypothetical protein